MRIALASLVVAATCVGAATAGSNGPTVSLAQASPVVLTGRGYPAHARIPLVYRSGATTVRRSVPVSSAGAFRLVLRGVVFARCRGLSLTAGVARLQVPSCAAGGSPRLGADPGGLVWGRFFVPGERVEIVARPSGGGDVSAVTSADPSGRFTLRLGLAQVRCAEVRYRASGSLGSAAVYSVPAPDCLAP